MAGPEMPQGDDLWFGRHLADGDMLVLDPAAAKSDSDKISFFSLSQFRTRTFPLSVVQRQIQEIVDPEQRARAESRYRSWPNLKAERDRAREQRVSEGVERQRESILEAHREYLESQNLPYAGVRNSDQPGTGAVANRRRLSCMRCGIALDDFVHARCEACGTILCSCGACGCKPPPAVS
jgi:hypothetical protein